MWNTLRERACSGSAEVYHRSVTGVIRCHGSEGTGEA